MYKASPLKKGLSVAAGISLPFIPFNSSYQSGIQTSDDFKSRQEKSHVTHLDGYYATSVDSLSHYYQKLPLDKSSTDRIFNHEREKIIGKATGIYYQLVPIPFHSHYTTENLSQSNTGQKIVPDRIFAKNTDGNEIVSLSNTVEVEAHTGEGAPVKRYSFAAPEGYSFLYMQGFSPRKLRHLTRCLPEYPKSLNGITRNQKKELEDLIK